MNRQKWVPFTVYWQISVNESTKMGAIHGFFRINTRINTLIADEKAGLIASLYVMEGLGGI